MSAVEGIDVRMLRRYVYMRKGVGEKAADIHNLTHLLSLLEHCEADRVPVGPRVLASFADQINSDICSIQELLDDFIFIVNAERTLAS